MQIKEIYTKSTFTKHYQRLPKKLRSAAKAKEALFREHPYHPSLSTHKLHGKERTVWAFWINQKYRIKFVFLTATSVLFLDVGTHDIYD